MLIKRTRKLSRLVLLATAFSILPGASHAAGTYCLNAFGQVHPSVWCDTSFVGTVSPTDQLNGFSATTHSLDFTGSGPRHGVLRGPNKGDLEVRGIAAPAVSVRVAVTDGVQTVYRVVPSSAVADAEAGTPAGSFVFVFGAGHFGDRVTGDPVNNPSGTNNNKCLNCVWIPGISDLGVHTASSAVGANLSLDPAVRGPSTLTVTSSWSGGSVTTTVTKYAGTYKDTSAPLLGGDCRTNDESSSGQPDEKSPCFPPTGTSTSSGTHYWCHTPDFFSSCPYNQSTIAIRGFTWDDGAGAFGHGSEIADVRLTVTQGSDVLLDKSIISNRQGPTARWNYLVHIDDYEPNTVGYDILGTGLFDGTPYNFTVTVTDAWGNSSTATSGNVWVDVL